MCGQNGIDIVWKNNVKKLKAIVFVNATPGVFFYKKVLPKSLILESKIENKNDDDKVDKLGGRTGTEGPFSC